MNAILIILILGLVIVVLSIGLYFAVRGWLKARQETKEVKKALEQQAEYIRQAEELRADTEKKKKEVQSENGEGLINYGNNLIDQLRNNSGKN